MPFIRCIRPVVAFLCPTPYLDTPSRRPLLTINQPYMSFLQLLQQYSPQNPNSFQDGWDRGSKMGEKLLPAAQGLSDLFTKWKMGRQSAAATNFIQNQPMQMPGGPIVG